MGCGQSKIHLYPRKSKSKANGKKSGHTDGDAEADEDEGHFTNGNEKDDGKDKDRIDDESFSEEGSPEHQNGDISVSLLRAKNLSLLQSQDISSSQQNFFRMLDQKIENGPDYDSSSETEMALEEARLNALVQHWESASLTASMCSSTSRSLQGTPVRQAHPSARQPQPHPQIRPQMQQPLKFEMLSQQQQLLLKQSQGSPKRDNRSLLSQSIIHQSYGVSQMNQSGITGGAVAGVTSVGGSGGIGTALASGIMAGNIPRQRNIMSGSDAVNCSTNTLPPHLSMAYYAQQPPSQPYFGEAIHSMQVPQPVVEPRFPPAISVQRLTPQVQRQLRETQELIKDQCQQIYPTGYGSPGPPLRAQQHRQPRRPPTLDTQFSQELS